MSKIKNSFFALVLCFFLLGSQVCIADEADLFSNTAKPDALIILDLSLSMYYTPPGGEMYLENASGRTCANFNGPYYFGKSGVSGWTLCPAVSNGFPRYSDSSCSAAGAYYKSSGSGHTVDCSRIAIAKRAIFALLDSNLSGQITIDDETSLGVRVGYMRFYNCSMSFSGGGASAETTGTLNYTSGCNTKIWDLSDNTRYSQVYNSVNGESAAGATHVAYALAEAKMYLDYNKSYMDPSGVCRSKSVVLITDGADTLSCPNSSGSASEEDANQYKRRKMSVGFANVLNQAGYRVFVIGVGTDMPQILKNTLNWMAYYGGSDNLAEDNVPSLPPAPPDPFPITPITIPSSGDTFDLTTGCTNAGSSTGNDPGNSDLSGYAYLTENPAELSQALKQTFDVILATGFSFSVSSVSSSRTALDNLIYAASFQPKRDPFWPGVLTQSTINTDGSLTAGWEAGSILNGNTSRNINTYRGGSVIAFDGPSWGTWKDYLGVGTANQAQAIIGYIRGDSSYNPDNWKLGDIFHSSPITVGKPNLYFEDPRDTNSRYDLYRNKSSIQNRAKIIVAGANDGQLHAFDGGTGSEVWSFIPPNLLPKLRFLAHTSHPTSLIHQFFVDGPISAADIWTGTGDGTAKGDNEWKTYLVFGEGKGVRDNNSTAGNTRYLWSSSQYCDQNFNSAYVWTSTYKYYCGYHALDVTATGSTPAYKWHINSDPATKAINSSHGPYLGEPWSKMAIGKVLISGNEKWVGIIGGGYGQSGNAGKGFFAIDLSNGKILWSYTNSDNAAMNYVPTSPTIVDADHDGFIDTAYVGDLNGNMWRFTFCTKAQGTSCGTGNWSGGRFFQPSTTVPIYTAATIARDWNSNLWVFWGTGDKMNPNNPSSTSAGKFFAVKDNSRSGNWTESDLQDITGTTEYEDTANGWYISLNSGGEKMLSDPTVFGGMLLFTTYLPYAGTNPCVSAGTAYLYAVAMQQVFVAGATYNTGAGLLDSGARSVSLGSGIASAPTIAQSSPGVTSSLFVSISGGVGIQGDTATTLPTVTKTKADFDPDSGLIKRLAETGVSTQMLHWRDGRMQ